MGFNTKKLAEAHRTLLLSQKRVKSPLGEGDVVEAGEVGPFYPMSLTALGWAKTGDPSYDFSITVKNGKRLSMWVGSTTEPLL